MTFDELKTCLQDIDKSNLPITAKRRFKQRLVSEFENNIDSVVHGLTREARTGVKQVIQGLPPEESKNEVEELKNCPKDLIL